MMCGTLSVEKSLWPNNWETLDIKHYFLFYPRANSNLLTGDCIPMNLSRPTLAELSEVQAELDHPTCRASLSAAG